MLGNPVGWLLSDLPFVNVRARTRLCEVVGHKIEMAQQDHARTKSTVMLHLRARNGPVLLEMVADTLDTEFDTTIVFTGRALESDLAGLLVCNSVAENDDDTQSDYAALSGVSSITMSAVALDDDTQSDYAALSGVSSITMSAVALDDDTQSDYAALSGVSSITMSAVALSSEISSITLPTHLQERHSRVAFRSIIRDDDDVSHSEVVTTQNDATLPWRLKSASTRYDGVTSIRKLQRLWRQHRADVVFPHSLAVASSLMLARTPARNGKDEATATCLIAAFLTGVPSASVLRSLSVRIRHDARGPPAKKRVSDRL